MSQENKIKCFICKEDFAFDLREDFETHSDTYVNHLLREHRILIPKFADFESLLIFCSDLNDFDKIDLNDRCSKFTMNKFDKNITYYIIDKEKIGQNDETLIKNLIEKDFLENILKEAQEERSNKTFNRMCLFCKKNFAENRALLFDHLYNDHNFFLGHPDNIINSNEFLDVLENKLKFLECLYCEKKFKSWNVLKEHMRKKGHKLLNPNNREYDRFYLINYLCNDKHWKQIKQENDFFIDNYNDDWCDWVENDKQDCLCFFCIYKSKFENVKEHMLSEHGFDFHAILTLQDFYHRIKVVNFIRKRLFTNNCYICDFQSADPERLERHMADSDHISKLPDTSVYDVPEYYFSTLEDDSFLFFLDDFSDIC